MKTYRITEINDGESYEIYRRRWWLWWFNALTFLTYAALFFWPPMVSGLADLVVAIVFFLVIEAFRAYIIMISGLVEQRFDLFQVYDVWKQVGYSYKTMEAAVEEVVALQNKTKKRNYYL